VEDTFFRSDLEYYKPSLYKLLDKHFNEQNEYSNATLIKLKNLIAGNKDMAFNVVLQKDIKTLQKDITASAKQFDDKMWRDMLPKIREEVKKTLGLDFKTRPVFFEESFPQGLLGFEKKGASSVTIFEGQKDSGIYFLNKRVSACFTPILMIHEQIHSCLSQNKSKDQIYIEWFEEGLCQWYSLKIYYNLTKNKEMLELYRQRCYIYSKVKDEHNFTKRYFEYMKIMSRLFLNGGQKRIAKILIDYMSNKRDKVNSYLDVADLEMKNLPENEIDTILVNFSFYVEPEKFPPIEYLILKSSLKPLPLDKISSIVKAPDDLVKGAIIALQVKGMLFIKGNNIEMNWRKRDLFEKGLIKPFWPL
jgi:hypothetical protein